MPSTVIRRFSHDADTRTLTVEFTSGVTYAYDDVPPDLPERWRAAYSKGRFFAAEVRDRFSCRRIEAWPEA